MSQASSRAGWTWLGTALLLAAGCNGAISGSPGGPGNPPGGPGAGGTGVGGSGTGGMGGNKPGGPVDIGFTTVARLNRLQYNNTVHDLLGTALNPADNFPPDETLGFDTNAGVLRVQPEHSEKYLDATATLIDEFFARPATDPWRTKYLTCDIAAGGPTCHRQVLKNFATKAWRRPVQDAELTAYATLAAAQPTPQAGLNAAMRAVLMSANFLYRVETDPNPNDVKAHRLTDHQLASRLSYFLWASMPDDQLSMAADSGALATDAGLKAQLTRLLGNPARARTLIDTFAAQWLGVNHMTTVNPDSMLFPAFTPAVRNAMIAESKEFMWDFLNNNRPITEVLGAPFTYANGPLAALYGLPGVTGDTVQRVSTTGSKRAGGLLTLGAFLVGESNPNRTSPVKRGLYVLERLLCEAPPPPPPDVVVNIDQGSGLDHLSVRERLAMHQKNGATCAACHVMMDAIGLGLENFDAIGRYRESDQFGMIDASAELPTDTGKIKFNGAGELAKILATDPRVTPCVIENLLSFSLGRSTEDEHPLRDQVAAGAVAAGGSLRAAVETVVLAEVFRSRRAASQAEVKP